MPDQPRTDALRPELLADFAGQPDITAKLGVIVGAANAREELPRHLLFYGPPGLGKTTLANIVANECDAELITTSGPALERPGDVASLLTSMGNRTVVFIDEIHRMPRTVEEILYPAMEDGQLDLSVGKGPTAKVVRIPLPKFCLVGATTQTGLLSGPLLDRFVFKGRLNPYGDDALAAIVARSATLLGLELSDDGAKAIALRSRGTPRVANSLLYWVRDWASMHDVATIDGVAADAALDALGIDPLGLDATALDYLRTLCTRFRGGPVGVETLAASIGEHPTSVKEVHEPFLMRLGFVDRTLRGRVATAAAYAHLGLDAPADTTPTPAQLPL